MADSDSIKEIINQAAMQAATVVMMAFRDTDAVPQPSMMQYQHENWGKGIEGWW